MSGTMRLRRFAGVLPLVICLLSGMGSACAQQRLTLEESVKVALQNNPTVQIARENIKRSNATITQAVSQGLPKITINGNYQRLDQVNTAEFGGNTIELGSIDNRTANLVVAQPIDAFGIVRTGTKVAKYTRTSSQHGLDQAVNDVTLQAKSAYFNVLRAQSLVKVQEETVAQLSAHLKDTEARQQAGDATKFEVLRAQTSVENARQALLAAQNGVQLAKAAFNNVLVRPLDTPVELAEPGSPKYYELDMAKCLECAVQHRPELLQADMAVKINDGITRVTELSGKPRINANWTANRNFDISLFNSRENSWVAYLTASINLYDGGATKSAVDIAECNAQNSRSTRQSVLDNINLQAKQAYLDVTSSRQRIEVATVALETAKESMRLADVRYKGGVSTLLEVLDAQQALTASSVGYVQALYDYEESVARLERAVGGSVQFAKLVTLQTASAAEPAANTN